MIRYFLRDGTLLQEHHKFVPAQPVRNPLGLSGILDGRNRQGRRPSRRATGFVPTYDRQGDESQYSRMQLWDFVSIVKEASKMSQTSSMKLLREFYQKHVNPKLTKRITDAFENRFKTSSLSDKLRIRKVEINKERDEVVIYTDDESLSPEQVAWLYYWAALNDLEFLPVYEDKKDLTDLLANYINTTSELISITSGVVSVGQNGSVVAPLSDKVAYAVDRNYWEEKRKLVLSRLEGGWILKNSAYYLPLQGDFVHHQNPCLVKQISNFRAKETVIDSVQYPIAFLEQDVEDVITMGGQTTPCCIKSPYNEGFYYDKENSLWYESVSAYIKWKGKIKGFGVFLPVRIPPDLITSSGIHGYHNDPVRQMFSTIAQKSPVFIAFELEKEDRSIATKIRANTDNIARSLREKGYAIETDSSLDGDVGFEVISPPISLVKDGCLEAHLADPHIIELCKGHHTSRCGGHITYSNSSYAIDDYLDSVKYSMPLLYALYNSRTGNRFCAAVSHKTMSSNVTNKYMAARLKTTGRRHLFEFRIFPAPKSVNNLKWRLALVRVLMEHPPQSHDQLITKMTTPNSVYMKQLGLVFRDASEYNKMVDRVIGSISKWESKAVETKIISNGKKQVIKVIEHKSKPEIEGEL